jgi:hypothetical protein
MGNPTILHRAGRAGLLSCALLGGMLVPRYGEGDEPPLRFALEGADGTLDIEVDRPFELTVGDRSVPFVLRAKPTRVLAVGGFALEYPRNMSFEFETDGNITTWTLDGNDVVVIVQRIHGAGASSGLADSIGEGIARAYEGHRTTIAPCEARIGGRRITGRRVEIDLLGNDIVQDVLPLCDAGDAAFVLILQDTRDEGGASSAEDRLVRELLATAFRWPGSGGK